MNKIIITKASEVIETVEKESIIAVLSIEHPGATDTGQGAAPRLDKTTQKILTFWDAEQEVTRILMAPSSAKQGI